jgi:hypothetical protein
MEQSGIIRYDYNPGIIPGYIIYTETEELEITDYSTIIGYQCDEDIGIWMGLRRIRRPIYETKLVLTQTWIAIPEENKEHGVLEV